MNRITRIICLASEVRKVNTDKSALSVPFSLWSHIRCKDKDDKNDNDNDNDKFQRHQTFCKSSCCSLFEANDRFSYVQNKYSRENESINNPRVSNYPFNQTELPLREKSKEARL